jgi:tryptophan synthase alpha subunit
VAEHADAVIIGSALVARIESLRDDPAVVARAGEFLAGFRTMLG